MIEIDHNGYEIRYSENDDLWRCWSLDVEAKTLSALRTKINKIDADARRVDNVQVLYIEYSGKVIEASATMLDGDQVWITYPDGRSRKRQKVGISNISIDDADSREAIEKWKAALVDQRRAETVARRLKSEIPCATAGRLSTCAKVAAE